MTWLWISLYALGALVTVPIAARWFERNPEITETEAIVGGIFVAPFWPVSILFAGAYLLARLLRPLIFWGEG